MSITEFDGRQICVSIVDPPIPVRHFDYCAYFDGDGDGLRGWGTTRDAAIADLIATLEDEQIDHEAD